MPRRTSAIPSRSVRFKRWTARAPAFRAVRFGLKKNRYGGRKFRPDAPDDRKRELAGNDELDFPGCLPEFRGGIIAGRLGRDGHPIERRVGWNRAVGLDLKAKTVAVEPLDERPDVLDKRLAPRQTDPPSRPAFSELSDPGCDRRDSHRLSASPGVLGVAKRAAKVAADQADEDGGPSQAEAFALDPGEDFSDLQRRLRRHPRIPRP